MIISLVLLFLVLNSLWIAYEMRHAPVIEDEEFSDEEEID